jgi:hypothetical protein
MQALEENILIVKNYFNVYFVSISIDYQMKYCSDGENEKNNISWKRQFINNRFV